MPRFRYKARDLQGRAVDSVVEAPSEEVLERSLLEGGLHLISAAEVQGRTRAPSALRMSLSSGPALGQRDLILFTMEIGTSYRAGLPLLGTLDDMAASAESRPIRLIAAGVADRVRSGSSLTEAMAAFPRAFPPLYVELVGAAERTGQLDKIMTDLVRFLEWQKTVKSQIASATIYPAALFGVAVLLVVVLSVWVFPSFLANFTTMGASLPLPTRILMAIDNIAKQHGSTALAVVVAIPVIFLAIRNIPVVRWNLDLLKLKLPALGPLLTKILMSRFSHNLAMMLASGLEFSQSLRIVERLMGNVVLSALVADARAAVEEGRPLSEAMKPEFVPSLVRRMLKLGESTGQMEKTLEHVSNYYDDEVPRAIKRTFAILEPTILVVMAGIVLFMAAAVFMPIYQMLEHFGGS